MWFSLSLSHTHTHTDTHTHTRAATFSRTFPMLNNNNVDVIITMIMAANVYGIFTMSQ